MSEWHPYGNQAAKGTPAQRSSLRAAALKSNHSDTAESLIREHGLLGARQHASREASKTGSQFWLAVNAHIRKKQLEAGTASPT